MNSSLLENDKQIDDQVIAQVPIWLTEDCIDLSDNRSIYDSDWIKILEHTQCNVQSVKSWKEEKRKIYLKRNLQ